MSDEIPTGGQVIDSPQPPKKGGRLPKLGPKAPRPKRYGPRAQKFGPRRPRATRGRMFGPHYAAPKYGPRAPRLRKPGPRHPRKPRVLPGSVRSAGGRRGGRSMGLMGWWKLLKRLAKPSKGSDFRNHGFKGSGKGGLTGRRGFQGPRGRLF